MVERELDDAWVRQSSVNDDMASNRMCTNRFSWPSPTSAGSPESTGALPVQSFHSSSSLSGATGFGGGFDMYLPAQTASVSLH